MNRKDELISLIPEDSLDLVSSVIDDMVFLEVKLNEIRNLPFIQVHPSEPTKQRNTPAAKMYKEFLQQYINCIKMIEYIIYKDKKLDDSEAEDSPLRKWFRDHADN